MVTMWAKIITDEKIVKDATIMLSRFEENNVNEYLAEVSYLLDIETPIVLDKHIKGFLEYNSASFSRNDFIEEVNYDKVVVEIY